MIAQLRNEKHELKNNYFYINGLEKEKRYRELEEYLDKNVAYRFSTMEEFHTGHRILDMLLTQKVQEAREKGIHVMVDVRLPQEFVIRDDNDLCSLLLNILNNAIDAEEKETHKDLQIRITAVKSNLSIAVRNQCSRDVMRENADLATTKKDRENHGIGLRIIRSVVKKHNGILNIYMQDGYFAVEAMLQSLQEK